jgi:hypothetical protein
MYNFRLLSQKRRMNKQNQKMAGKAAALISSWSQSRNALSEVNNRRENRTVVSNLQDCFIEVLHRDADSHLWMVRRFKKVLWFKKRISSDWFVNRQQAFIFANAMKGKYYKHHHIHDTKEKQHHAS